MKNNKQHISPELIGTVCCSSNDWSRPSRLFPDPHTPNFIGELAENELVVIIGTAYDSYWELLMVQVISSSNKLGWIALPALKEL